MFSLATLRTQSDPPHLTQSQIFQFFLPLAASWCLMSLEGPIAAGLIGRLEHPVQMLAGFGVGFSIAFFIESTVIGLLATSTALAVNRQHYLLIRKFVLWLMVITTAFVAGIAFSPIYEILTMKVIGVSQSISDAGRPALIALIPFSAGVAWRRYTQGILIRNGQPRFMAFGTIVRTVSLLSCAIIFISSGTVPGATAAGISISSAVIAEALLTHLLARPTIRDVYDNPEQELAEPLTIRALLQFHIPLSLSSVLWLLAKPMVQGAIARGKNPDTSLAAWEPSGNMLFVFRAPASALPEAVITLQKDEQTETELRRFCISVGIVTSAILAAFAFSPAGLWFIRGPLHVPEESQTMCLHAMQAFCLAPMVNSLQSYFRGMLSYNRATKPQLISMLVYVISSFAFLFILVSTGNMNVVNAAIALTIAMMLESVVLGYSYSVVKRLSRQA